MSVPTSSQSDRRNPILSRVPFEALVEIAAPQGTSFEAESIDLSATGMHLRTAYLPEVGTALTFRFEGASETPPILAGGQVVWAHDGPEGCEFGVRFAELEAKNAAAIRQIVGVSVEPPAEAPKTLIGVGPVDGPTSTPRLSIKPGSPVRIHIEGVSAPMRATLRDDASRGAIVGSELKMLRLGAVVELEDKEHRTRRSARVDGVDCEIDDESKIPQLVVRLRYDVAATAVTAGTSVNEGASMGTAKNDGPAIIAAPREATMPPPAMSKSETIGFDRTEKIEHETQARDDARESDGEAMGASSQQRISLPVAEESGKLDVVADGMKKVGSAMRDAMSGAGAIAARFGLRAKNTVSLLKGRAGSGRGEEEVRRTTSPAPGNAGQKSRVLRPQGASRDFLNSMNGEGSEEGVMQEIDTKKSARRKQIGIAMGVGLALVLAFFAFRKPKSAPVVQAPAPELAPAPAPAPLPVAPIDTNAVMGNAAPLAAAAPLAGEPTGVDGSGKPNPFGTTTVKKGTRMTLHLDGPITELRGIATTNGFVVAVPNRKSTEAANPLAAKDARIASAKVANVPGGAELTITFKDNVPSYVVRAKGDALEIVLSKDKAVAKKPAKKAPAKKKK